MMKKLQQRFIRIALVSLTIAMVLVVGIVNIANWISVRNELSNTLNLLVQTENLLPGGTPPQPPEEGLLAASSEETPAVSSGETPAALLEETPTPQPKETTAPENTDSENSAPENSAPENSAPPFFPLLERSRHFRNMLAESNWFSAMVSADGKISAIMMKQMQNLEEDAARELILRVVEDGRSEGFLQDYLFRVRIRRDGVREVVMLSCETRLASVRTLVLISVIACVGGILLALLLVSLASRKAVEPIIRNMELQKQFITNASHELKTPLTVIATNMELLQMEMEGNPWVRSTQKQTAALRRLVDELVYLSRMEEEHPTLEKETLDPGALLEETAEPFVAMAEYSGREMTVQAEKGLQMTGDRASLQRLMSTLCDNAVKYASAGPILAEIRAEGKNILLRVSNPVETPLTRQQCDQLFDRFYRADPSRNKEKQSGFGIGLAIAAAIAEKHGGKISAAMEENRLSFTCLLPK